MPKQEIKNLIYESYLFYELKYLSILKLKKGCLILIKNHPNIRKVVIIELLPLEKRR